MKKCIFGLLFVVGIVVGMLSTVSFADGGISHEGWAELKQTNIEDYIVPSQFGDYYCLPSGDYFLGGTISVDKWIEIGDGSNAGNITLDLNGFELKNVTNSLVVLSFPLSSKATTFTLTDGSSDKTGKVIGNLGGAINFYKGTFYVNGGTVEGEVYLNGRGIVLENTDPSNITVFNDSVTAMGCNINGGIFNGTLDNVGSNISGGIFYGGVTGGSVQDSAKVTVTFDSDGGENIQEQKVIRGYTASEPTAPNRMGYIFDSWYKDNTEFDFDTRLIDNMTLKANWIEKSEASITTNTQTYGYNGETKTFEILGTDLTGFDIVYKQNNQIVEPINAGTYTVDISREEDSSYKAVNMTLTDGLVIEPKSIESAIVVLGEALTYNGTEQTKNVTVVLDGFETVTFDVSGDKQTDVNVSGDYILTVTANGNFTGTKKFDWNIMPATPTENPERKTTARLAKGRKLADASVTKGEFFALDGTTLLNGTLAWCDNTKVIKADGTEKMTFTPENINYAPITTDVAVKTYSSGGGAYTPTTYIVKFETNGGTTVAKQTVVKNKKANQPNNPTKDGYVFDGWYTDGELTNEYDFATSVTKNMILYAKWNKEEWKTSFTDVQENDWFYEDVAYVYGKELMNGTSTTTFSPNKATTHGMVVTILYRLDGSPAVDSSCPFDDVDSNAYYKDAIIWAITNGITSGYGNNLFGPNDNITREQLATFLYRYAKYKGMDVSVGENTNILSYNDALNISEYAFPAMQWLCGEGIMQGSDGNLMPTSNGTRAQIAAFLHRFCEKMFDY